MSPWSDSSHVNVPQPRRTLQIFSSHGKELLASLRVLSNCWKTDVLFGRTLFAAEGWSRRSAAGSEPAFVFGQQRARCCWPPPDRAGPRLAAAVSVGAIVPRWCSAEPGRGSRNNACPVRVEACCCSGAGNGGRAVRRRWCKRPGSRDIGVSCSTAPPLRFRCFVAFYLGEELL